MSAEHVPACQCGVRPAAGCPSAWEQGCDLGSNPDHVRVAPASAAAAVVRTEAIALLDYCRINGLVLTIEQVPLQPLAMGHYVSCVSVRPVRSKA